MKKLIFITIMLISFIAYTAENPNLSKNDKSIKTELIKKDSVKKDSVSKAEKIVAAANDLTEKLKESPMPDSTGGWNEWMLYVAGILIPLLLQWFTKWIPTSQNWKIFHLVSRLADLLFNISKFIYKIGNIVPNRKKGGGTFAQKVFVAKREEEKNIQ